MPSRNGPVQSRLVTQGMDKQWHCSLKELVQALCPAPFLSGSNTISCGGHGFRDYTHALRVGSQRLTGADADLYLVAEILAEVSGTDALRAIEGLTRLWRVLVLGPASKVRSCTVNGLIPGLPPALRR